MLPFNTRTASVQAGTTKNNRVVVVWYVRPGDARVKREKAAVDLDTRNAVLSGITHI